MHFDTETSDKALSAAMLAYLTDAYMRLLLSICVAMWRGISLSILRRFVLYNNFQKAN